MDANIIIGEAILALALVTGGFLAAIVLAASGVSRQREARTADASLRSAKGLLAAGPADCYYQCMSGFRWSDDWENLCGEACGIGITVPRKTEAR